MSSPIHHAKDVDAALVYAPPWARDPGRPPVPIEESLRLRRAGNTGGGFSGDRAMSELQRQLALNPGQIPEPPVADARRVWPLALRLCAVTGAAALVAWGIVMVPVSRKAASEVVATKAVATNPVETKAVETKAVETKAMAEPAPVKRVKLVRVETALAASTPPLPDSLAPQIDVPAVAEPPTPAAQAISSIGDNGALGSDEIATFVKRGKDLLINGDLASARLLLRRAAEAGSAEAALALGATFDPLVIRRLGAVGAEPDIGRAREWYQKAVDLGSQDASAQLAKLAQASQ